MALKKEMQAEERLEGIRRSKQQFEEVLTRGGSVGSARGGIVDVSGTSGVDMRVQVYGSSLEQMDRSMGGAVSVCFQYGKRPIVWYSIVSAPHHTESFHCVCFQYGERVAPLRAPFAQRCVRSNGGACFLGRWELWMGIICRARLQHRAWHPVPLCPAFPRFQTWTTRFQGR